MHVAAEMDLAAPVLDSLRHQEDGDEAGASTIGNPEFPRFAVDDHPARLDEQCHLVSVAAPCLSVWKRLVGKRRQAESAVADAEPPTLVSQDVGGDPDELC